MSKDAWDLVAIDPGNDAGVAYFENKRLVRAELITDVRAPRERELAHTVIIEVPQVYPHSPVNPNNLLTLSFTAGLLAGHFESSNLAKASPRQWKGQRPKDVDNRYTLDLLDAKERSIVNTSTSRGQLHNVIDAVGIGLWFLKRR